MDFYLCRPGLLEQKFLQVLPLSHHLSSWNDQFHCLHFPSHSVKDMFFFCFFYNCLKKVFSYKVRTEFI